VDNSDPTPQTLAAKQSLMRVAIPRRKSIEGSAIKMTARTLDSSIGGRTPVISSSAGRSRQDGDAERLKGTETMLGANENPAKVPGKCK
jgi:hypothetical protein